MCLGRLGRRESRRRFLSEGQEALLEEVPRDCKTLFWGSQIWLLNKYLQMERQFDAAWGGGEASHPAFYMSTQRGGTCPPSGKEGWQQGW